MKKISIFSTLLLLSALSIVGCKDDPARPVPMPPEVNISFPGDSATVSDTILVSVDATDDFGVTLVKLTIDDTLIFTDIDAPYEFEWNVRVYADSSWHTLYATATDLDTMTSTSDTIRVQVNHGNSSSGQQTLIVANDNSGAGTISLLDLVGDDLKKDVVTGLGNAPNDIVWKNSKLYVTNSNSNDMNVFTINYNNDIDLLATYDLGLADNRSPQFADVATNGRMYVSNFNTNDVTVYDPANGRTLLRIPVGSHPADVMAIGNVVYVCNTGFNFDDFSYDSPGTISVLSTVENFVIDTVELNGVNPQFMALDGSGRLHVVCTGNYDDQPGKIYVLNPVNREVELVVNMGGQPGHLVITDNNMAYVAAGGWDNLGAEHGAVYMYNANTGEIFNGPTNPIQTGLGAVRVAAASDHSIYVACIEDDQIDKIVDNQVVSSFPVGDGPSALYMLER